MEPWSDAEEKIVRQAAGIFCRKSWWVDEEEARQAARIEIVRSRGGYDPSTGMPYGGYAYRTAVQAIRRAVWKDSSPVSGGSHRPEKSHAGLYRASLDEVRGHHAGTRDADDALYEARWLEHVRDELRRIAVEVCGDYMLARATLDVVTDKVEPEEAAITVGACAQHVHKLSKIIRKRIAGNAKLYTLTRERIA